MSDPPCAITARRGRLTVGATGLSYLEWPADGPPALLLHGITSSAATLWKVGPALAAAGYRTIALDMPGHGESDMSPAHDIATIAGLAGGAIAGLGLAEVTLLGHSWGGATALALAGGDHPARALLRRVVLVDPLLGLRAGRSAELLPRYSDGVGLPADVGAPRIRAANPDYLPCDVHWKALAMEQCRLGQVAGLFGQPADWDLLGHLDRVAVPLLLLVCDPQFTVIPPELLRDAGLRLVPGRGEIRHIPGTNHNMLRGAGYQPTIAAILGWLGVTTPRGAGSTGRH